MSEYQLSEKQTAVAMLVQSALFIAAGIWLNSLASKEALNEIPVTDVFPNPIAAIFFVILSIVIAVGINLGLYALMTKTSERFRIADRESSLKMKEMLYLNKPSSLSSMFHASLGEEMLFRYGGVTLVASALMSLGNPATYSVAGAVFIVSVIFAIVHNQYSSVGHIAAVFVAGLAFGTIYVLSGSVLVIWIAHFISNVAAVVLEPRILKMLGYEDSPLGDNFFVVKLKEQSNKTDDKDTEEKNETNTHTNGDNVRD